jgi:hypothetical protein
MPFGIRRMYMPAMKLLRLIRSFAMPLSCFEGEEYSSGDYMKVAYLGWDKAIISYWLKRLFNQEKQVQVKKLIPVWEIDRYFKKNADHYDLALVEMNSWNKKFTRINSGYIFPRWLEMKMDIEKSINLMKDSDKTRRIRKHGLSVEKRYSEADFKLFYDRMYKPFISAQHKDAAVLADYKYFLNIFRRKGSQLYFIMKDGEPVAGSLHETRGNNIRMSGLGILDGREDIKKLGVIGAIYYFQALDYSQRNIKSVSIGRTSPILTDALTRFKLYLGGMAFETVHKEEEYVWLIPVFDSKAARYVLSSNPFVSITKKGYQRNIFFNPEIDKNKNDFLLKLKRTTCENIKITKIFCLTSAEILTDWIRPEESAGIEIIVI